MTDWEIAKRITGDIMEWRSKCGDSGWYGIPEEWWFKFIADRVKKFSLNPSVSSSFSLDELERKLDDALAKETPESLKQWLEEKRK